jgi:hypothetical protein
MEPFNPGVQQSPSLLAQLRKSFALVAAGLS